MATPLDKTFDLLARTKNASAVGVLVAVLDVADEEVQALAVGALLSRGPAHGIVEIIRRNQVLARPARELVARNAPQLSRGLRDSLDSGDAPLRANALELVRQLEEFSELPTLARLLEEHTIREREAIEDALFDLVNRLYDTCNSPFAARNHRFLRMQRPAPDAGDARIFVSPIPCPSLPTVVDSRSLSDPENIYLKKLFGML